MVARWIFLTGDCKFESEHASLDFINLYAYFSAQQQRKKSRGFLHILDFFVSLPNIAKVRKQELYRNYLISKSSLMVQAYPGHQTNWRNWEWHAEMMNIPKKRSQISVSSVVIVSTEKTVWCSGVWNQSVAKQVGNELGNRDHVIWCYAAKSYENTT